MKKKKEEIEETDNEERMSYEELNNVCNQLYMQNQQMAERLRILNSAATRLPSLFKVIENERYFSASLVEKCAEEIENILYPQNSEKK